MHDTSTANHSADEAAVRALYQLVMDGWNQGSGMTFGLIGWECCP